MELLETELAKINARVERGIAHLDKNKERTWPFQIDMETFDMNDWGECILGQLDMPGKYEYSPVNVKRGFVASSRFSEHRGHGAVDAVNKYHRELTNRWKTRIRELRHVRRKERSKLTPA